MFRLKASWALLPAIVGALGSTLTASAAPPWIEQGPFPFAEANTEGVNMNAIGAINTVAPSLTDPNTVFVGCVNGGIWKTSNATALSPTWVSLTDFTIPGLNINWLALSPVDPNTIFAGTGSTSSFGFIGRAPYGLLRSTDGGTTWQTLAASNLGGLHLRRVLPTPLAGGNVVLVANWDESQGLFRSVDNGTTFTQISGTGGLPAGGVTDIVEDPQTPLRFYAAVPASTALAADAGVYKSEDGGVNWSRADSGLPALSTSFRILLAVHATGLTNAAYAAIFNNSGHLGSVSRSANMGGTWGSMGVPSPEIEPGGQAQVHGAIVADKNDANIVYLSGDRQSNFPFSANVFRGDNLISSGSKWISVVKGNAQGTSPHPDSRSMALDANGDLLQSNDGGVYKLLTPGVALTRKWVTLNGNLRCTEAHSMGYDSFTKTLIVGTQDNGTVYQGAPNSATWFQLLGGDGGNVAVDSNQAAHPGVSIRYSCFQNFQFFNRSRWDSGNNFLSRVACGLRVQPGNSFLLNIDFGIQFYQNYVLNSVDPSRMLILTSTLYESLDMGDNLNVIASLPIDGNSSFFGTHLISYGSRLNGVLKPDALYAGQGTVIKHRVDLAGPITTLSAYPGSAVRSVIMDPQNYKKVYVLDSVRKVWFSSDEGASWLDLTLNLPALTGSLRAMELYSPDASPRNTVLIVGGTGIFQLRRPGAAGTTWTPLSSGLANGLVYDIHYEYVDDTLALSTLGRGAWTLKNYFRGGGGTGTQSTYDLPAPASIEAPFVLPPNAVNNN